MVSYINNNNNSKFSKMRLGRHINISKGFVTAPSMLKVLDVVYFKYF